MNMVINQMILVTDGESNTGISPVEAAKISCEKGIKVSTIGIVDNMRKEKSLVELEMTAQAGGGIGEITDIESLYQTLSKVTVNSVYKTIEEAVNKELKNIINKDMTEIQPKERKRIVQLIDKLEEEASLKCMILLDTSGSMNNKIEIAKKSILELLNFLNERKGETYIGVCAFSKRGESFFQVLCDFTHDIDILEGSLKQIKTGGTTPTGPAIIEGINFFHKEKDEDVLTEYTV
ncbi:VWA domain-containing protein [Acidilutibacter cellobiosedens]|jgi:Ca-activated chloride channel family protein|uniref:VWA domain-containing protein n=2 Tax=Tissierellia TaxID=1737404 RepID=A0A410QF94_9FIRM|nr:VWA domain-containing protein [Tissierellaceae bacterium]QAT62752.1 VWA domain-containing protein [Acidilutibacter cellobiosedens]